MAVLLAAFPAALVAQAQQEPGPRAEEGRAAGGFHYVFLFDVSGSMKTTLGPSGSPARQYLAERLFATPGIFLEGQPASAYSFTVQCHPEFSGPLRVSAIQDLLRTGLPVTHGNTDLVETLRQAQADYAQKAQGAVTLAWILTDNINDPAGQGADDLNTRAFYAEMFSADTRAQRMYFFPLKDLKLVLYLLVLGPDAALRGLDIDRFEDGLGAFATALGAPKIRAKPVGGGNPLEFSDLTFSGEDTGVMAEVIGTGANSSLAIHGLKEGKTLSGQFHLRVRSRFDEWRIEHASVETTRLEDLASDDFTNIGGKMSARLSPSGVTVDPRSASGIVYTLNLGEGEDQIPQAPFFHLAALNPDGFGVVTGRLIMKIGDPRLTLKIFNDPATTQAVQSIFRLKDIEYFVPKAAAGKELRLDLAFPVRMEVGYNYLPRWLALGGTLLLGCIGMVWALRGRNKAVQCRLIGYQEEPFTLTGNAAFPISHNGARVAELRKSFSGGIVCRPMPGITINNRHGAAPLVHGSKIDLAAGETVYSYRLEIVPRRSAAAREEKNTPAGGYY